MAPSGEDICHRGEYCLRLRTARLQKRGSSTRQGLAEETQSSWRVFPTIAKRRLKHYRLLPRRSTRTRAFRSQALAIRIERRCSKGLAEAEASESRRRCLPL